MIVLIDGKEVECLNDVKVIWEAEDGLEKHLTLTHESAIFDVIDEITGEAKATQSAEAEDFFCIILSETP